MIEIKTPEQLEIMRHAGHKLANCLVEIAKAAIVGVTTQELDELAETLIRHAGGKPNFKGYGGFPSSICTSVNDQVIHGFPNKRALVAGDVLTIDIGLEFEGWNVDHATTLIIGQNKDAETQKKAERFLKTGKQALDAAISATKPGAKVGDLSWAMQSTVESAGYSVIREYTGHGVGRELHMDPIIPCFGRAGTGIALEVGMTLAIEIMMNMGGPETKTLKDGWTVVTRDHSLSAQFEHTVAVVEEGFEILTLPSSDTQNEQSKDSI